jgi:hypothetical protein
VCLEGLSITNRAGTLFWSLLPGAQCGAPLNLTNGEDMDAGRGWAAAR